VNKRSYYEILGVAPHVGSGQIQAAYRFTRGLYSGDGAATYGFMDASERAQMLALVDEAYAALSNPNARRDYDAHLNDEALHGSPAPPAPKAGPVVEPKAARVLKAPALVEHAAAAAKAPLAVPETVNGKVLRGLRETRGLSLEQIAALSKVGTRFLAALEDDRHEALPGRVFARGFLIEYARAVHVTETELVDRYLRGWHGK
jgi:curved DNA-binding protein CbpA